eukprot:396580-Amphidinium_carterae.1
MSTESAAKPKATPDGKKKHEKKTSAELEELNFDDDDEETGELSLKDLIIQAWDMDEVQFCGIFLDNYTDDYTPEVTEFLAKVKKVPSQVLQHFNLKTVCEQIESKGRYMKASQFKSVISKLKDMTREAEQIFEDMKDHLCCSSPVGHAIAKNIALLRYSAATLCMSECILSSGHMRH